MNDIPTMLTGRAGVIIETVPVEAVCRRNGAHGSTRLQPLFPGLLFVQMQARSH